MRGESGGGVRQVGAPHSGRVLVKPTRYMTHTNVLALTFPESDESGTEDDSTIIKQTVKGPRLASTRQQTSSLDTRAHTRCAGSVPLDQGIDKQLQVPGGGCTDVIKLIYVLACMQKVCSVYQSAEGVFHATLNQVLACLRDEL